MKNYDDIINLPHPVSLNRPQMSLHDRAAQFSPFAALTGFEGVIDETARLTTQKRVLDEEEKLALDRKLAYLTSLTCPEISVEYFVADERKEGGSYDIYTGVLKKIDGYERKLVFVNDKRISVDDIVDLTGEIFDNVEE